MDFAILTVIALGFQGRFHIAIEHVENGFNLPTLA